MAEMVDLEDFVPRVRAFLSELAANNTRDWFKAHKTEYDGMLKRPGERLLTELAPVLAEQTGQPIRTKLFRPHRDLRFSNDKTPYHTHLHLAWSAPDGRGWYLGLSNTYATAGAGIMQFDAPQLDRFRDAVDSPAGTELATILSEGDWRLDPPALKRVPAPYDADHSHAEHLKRKALVVWHDNLDAGLTDTPVATLEQVFAGMAPLQRWLSDQVADD
ncbi:MAG: TIGR02453 family protein [Paracoccaceae bacterium]|nr:TIGR02453 family protein [Paracoccaceae bacterium]